MSGRYIQSARAGILVGDGFGGDGGAIGAASITRQFSIIRPTAQERA